MPELDLLAVAEDGEAAFKLVQLHHPDVAVLDVEMPKANGPQDRRRRPGHPRALPRNGCSTIFCSTANAINATGGNPGGELTQSYSTLVGIAGLATGTTQATSSSFAWTADEPADLHVTSTARPTSRRCCRWAARPRRCSSSWTSPPARPARSRRTPSPRRDLPELRPDRAQVRAQGRPHLQAQRPPPRCWRRSPRAACPASTTSSSARRRPTARRRPPSPSTRSSRADPREHRHRRPEPAGHLPRADRRVTAAGTYRGPDRTFSTLAAGQSHAPQPKISEFFIEDIDEDYIDAPPSWTSTG